MTGSSARTSDIRPGRAVRAFTAAVAGAALVATGLVGSAAAVAAPGSPGEFIPTGQSQVSLEPGRYIVTLSDAAAAVYEGGVTGLAPTRPDPGEQLNARRQVVQRYVDYLTDKQKAVAASVGASIGYSYTFALNGFSAVLDSRQLEQLARDKNVLTLEKDSLHKLMAPVPSTDFLGLSGPGGVWDATGGAESAGEGVVLGVLDSGIAPENPSFAGDPLGTTAGDEPYYSAPGVTTFDKSDGDAFTGVCQTGEQFTLDDCSTKLIGARYFIEGFGDIGAGVDYLSPRDGDGHGSHTASTAVGNAGVEASVAGQSFGEISGVAPAAKVAAYKVCWSGVLPTTADDGCVTSDLVAAINAAVADGVDAMNFSIGSGSGATSTFSATDRAFLGAASAGVFVAASAGNSGPAASTVDNAAPWITTVAASSIPTWESTAALGNGAQYAGGSSTVDYTPGADELSGPLVTATAVAVAEAETPELCVAGSLDPVQTAGAIVVCLRGVNDRVAKSAEVARAGGIGMILVNPVPNSIDLDTHSVPTIHIDSRFAAPILDYAATEGATVTLVPGNETDYRAPTPQVTGFSSRGPVLADGADLLKPDITAPGAGILADGANADDEDPSFEFLSGTSMSSPHIAGLAVLYLGERPNASPAEIKSAMMTTAYDTVDADGDPITDPFAQGAGHVDPRKFLEPGLLYLAGTPDWLSYVEGLADWDVADPAVLPIDGSALNLPSLAIGALTASETVTRTVTSTEAGTFTASVEGLEGMDVSVEPATLEFGAAGETQTFAVTFARTDAPLDQFVTGSLEWTSGDTVVHSPVAVQPVTIVVPTDATGEGVTGSTDITVTPGGDGDIPLTTTGLTPGDLQADPSGDESDHSGSGVTGDLFTYEVEVPGGSTYARFDLDAVDDATDLDLYVSFILDDGTPQLRYLGATGSADERVDIVDPEPGTYLVEVDLYSAPAPAGTAFDLYSWAVAPGGAPVSFSPPAVPGVQGEPTVITASWSGLVPRTVYLGEIGYGETGASTLLEVATGEAPAPVATTTALALSRSILYGGRSTARVTVAAASGETPTGTVVITVNGNEKARIPVTADAAGKVSYQLPKLGRGIYRVQARFVPDDGFTASTSAVKRLFVIR